jgi:hypothetical protein
MNYNLQIGEPRQKDDSVAKLKSMFTTASTVGNLSRVKAMKTASGLKDTYLESFMDHMASSYKKKQGKDAKQKALDDLKQTLPENVISPVWRIKGL